MQNAKSERTETASLRGFGRGVRLLRRRQLRVRRRGAPVAPARSFVPATKRPAEARQHANAGRCHPRHAALFLRPRRHSLKNGTRRARGRGVFSRGPTSTGKRHRRLSSPQAWAACRGATLLLAAGGACQRATSLSRSAGETLSTTKSGTGTPPTRRSSPPSAKRSH